MQNLVQVQCNIATDTGTYKSYRQVPTFFLFRDGNSMSTMVKKVFDVVPDVVPSSIVLWDEIKGDYHSEYEYPVA